MKGAAKDQTAEPKSWELRLYVAGQTARSVAAFGNLKKLCEEHLNGQYTIEVIDLLEQPQLAAGDEIVAIPTLEGSCPHQWGRSSAISVTRSARW